ncbi:MAG: flagellar biosynthetic protein FliQ [Alsobacter sp.]
MTSEAFTHEIYAILVASALFAGPALLLAAVIGLILGVLQAITQIQDQTLGQVVKIVVISLALMGLGGRLAAPLHDKTVQLFASFPTMVR